MPHDADERLCPNTGLRMPTEARHAREARTRMPEPPPPPPKPVERPPAHGREDTATGQLREHQRALIGQNVGGRYRIKGMLGEGGMGTVYDAEHLGLSRHVAIKVLSPTQAKKKVAVKRFQQEARAAGAIGHPNICEVYDMGLLDDGSPYLVMEKLIGQTLAERIAKEGGLPFEEVVEVISQVLSGLIAAHDKGIVHRDIKPENIFLARRLGSPPIIKLLDFGVSKMMPEFQTGEDALDLTRTGMVMGTPYYMSPEQARGERNLDGRVDVYACGVVMYEAIVGKRPFLAPNYNALLLAIINTTPRPIRDLRPKTPPELEAIIARAMAKNRADRFPSAKHFLRELAPTLAASEGSSGRLPPPPTPEERKRAPVLGGGRSRPDDSEPWSGRRSEPSPPPPLAHEPPPEPASAMLRQRMADPAHDTETRVDHRVRLVPPPYDGPPRRRETPLPSLRSSYDTPDSVEIPIHVSPLSGEDDDDGDDFPDEATEVFKSGKHGFPPRPPPPAAPSRPAPRAQPTGGDDWEGETIVTRPAFEPGAPLPVVSAPPAPRRRREPRPFNPDETVKLDNTGDIEIIDERQAPPRRR